MDQRDQELDAMLESLRGDTPTTAELQRWQTAVARFAVTRRPTALAWPLLAAGVVGALLGAASARVIPSKALPCDNSAGQRLAADISDADATSEVSYVKLD